jgi:hypothetical protein
MLLAIAAGGWWLQRVAFDTTRSADVADVVLENDEIRGEVASLVAAETATVLGVPAAEVRVLVEGYVQSNDPDVRAVLATVVSESHARLIGVREDPVQLTGAQLVQLVRNERAADLGPVTLPVEEVVALGTARVVLGWMVPIAAIAGGVALLLGVVAHPQKADAVFGLGVFCLVAAVIALGLGYALPVFLVPAISDETWAAVIPAVADHALPLVAGVAVLLVAVGIALLVAGATARRRKMWSTPVSVGRYSDQHHWS